MRFIVDTNLLISAIIKPESVPGIMLAKVQKTGRLCFSDETQKEISEVLMRVKFDRYLQREERSDQLNNILHRAHTNLVPKHAVLVCRDHKDNKFLDLAIMVQADAIITGDQDLLILHPFEGIPILSASDFLARF